MEYTETRTRPLFGFSGLDDTFYGAGLKHTYQMPKWLREIGLDAFEYSFGRGVNIGVDSAKKIGEQCQEYNIKISGHAPYFVNYTNPDPEKIANSHRYIIEACQAIQYMKGERVVVHVAVERKDLTREQSVELVAENMKELSKKMDENGLENFILCLETMGKYSQIGTYKEIARLCTQDPRFIPCFDFGHINCTMQGKLTQPAQFEEILTHCIDTIGHQKVKNTHVHFSKIQFSAKGEVKHINFDDTVYGPDFEPFGATLAKLNLTPTIINESMTTRTQDAMYMRDAYDKIIATTI